MKKLLFLILLLGQLVAYSQPRSRSSLVAQANIIKNEANAKANTALRIGQMFVDMINNMPTTIYGYTATGSGTYAVTVSPSVTSYVDGQFFLVKFTNTNGASPTISVNGRTALDLVKPNGTSLTSGDIPTGSYQWIGYDGVDSNFKIIGSFSSTGTGDSPSASDTVSGIMKLYGTTGSNTDGTITQAYITALLAGKQPLDGDLTTIGSISPANDDIIQRKAGVWTNRTVAQYKTDLGLGTLATQNGTSPSGTIVGTTDTQTLTNKTLTSPLINFGSDVNGDIIVRTGGAYTRLPIGTSNQVLTINSGLPSWQDAVRGSATFIGLTDGPGAFTGKSLNFTRVNVGETALEYQTPSQVKTDLSLTKTDVGLSNVDNTSDATKNAASVTLTNKTLTSPIINTPTGIVKGDVGLGNVDNTSDASKPVSTAQATADATVLSTSEGYTDAAIAQEVTDRDAAIGSALSGLSWKNVRVATTIAGVLSTSFENGDVIDGVTLVTGNRILIKSQVTTSENGIYVVAISGSPARATDSDTNAELQNAAVLVAEGTAGTGTAWVQTQSAINIGSTAVVFQQLGSSTPNADASTRGIAKLYTNTGSNTDGAIDQNATTTALAAKAAIASPTFTGTVTIPSTFTLGATSVTTTGTQLNYLNAATGTTGTSSSNVVYSSGPTLTNPIVGTQTAGDNSTKAASTSYVDTGLAAKQNTLGYAPLAPASNLSDVDDPVAALQNIGGLTVTPNVQTTSYTILASDFEGYHEIIMNNGSSANITVPDGLTLDAGQTVWIRRINSGSVTIVQGGSQVVVPGSGSLTLANRDISYYLRYDGTSTWNLGNGLPNPNAAADGTTKGVMAGNANDFDASSGVFSIDWVNTQKATSTQPGAVSSTDWSTFNNKLGASQEILIYQALGSTIKAQTFGCVSSQTSQAITLTSGALRFTAVYLPQAATLTGVKFLQTTAGSYTASNNNRVDLYTYSGGTLTLVASSTNNGNAWVGSSNSVLSIAFTSTYPAIAGLYYVAFLYSRSGVTTDPIIAGCATTTAFKTTLDFTNSASLFGQITGQTDIPSPSQAASGIAAQTSIPWVALY